MPNRMLFAHSRGNTNKNGFPERPEIFIPTCLQSRLSMPFGLLKALSPGIVAACIHYFWKSHNIALLYSPSSFTYHRIAAPSSDNIRCRIALIKSSLICESFEPLPPLCHLQCKMTQLLPVRRKGIWCSGKNSSILASSMKLAFILQCPWYLI